MEAIDRLLEYNQKQSELHRIAYGKELAINFIKWAIENHSVTYEGFSFPVWINGKEHDAEKLFDVYIQSKRM